MQKGSGFRGPFSFALLFGGTAADYAISTIDSLPANIDHLAWVSTYGGACGVTFPCGTKVGEAFEIATGGLYVTPGDTSAYVRDWAVGVQYTNFAFRNAVPEPESWALMIGGLALAGGVLRRRRLAVAFA